MVIAIYINNIINFKRFPGGIMNKIIEMLEDLWVAIAFAEAGVYELSDVHELQPHCQETVRIHAA